MSDLSKICPLVYIVALNYNGFNLTSEFIESINQLTYTNYKILVVENGSLDNSYNQLVEAFPEITLIQNKSNLSYCKAFNIGIREALRNGANYVFIVSNDTKDFSSNYLEEIIQAFEENNKIGLVGSNCYNYDGIKTHGDTKIRFGIPNETPAEGLVIKRDVFEKIGGLDEKLAIYFEDLDFIIRLRNAGYKTKNVSSVSFAHLGNATVSKERFMPNYFRVRNIIWFIRRYCADKSFKWKIREFIINMQYHVKKLLKSAMNLDFTSFVIVGYAILKGIISGFVSKWNPETELDKS